MIINESRINEKIEKAERVTLTENVNEAKSGKQSVRIDDNDWEERGGSYAFPIERSDGVRLPGKVYFPKSVVTKGSTANRITTFTIPNWILEKKLTSGQRIAEA